MKTSLHLLVSLPLGRNSDIVLAVAAGLILVILIVPLPPAVLDVLLAGNISVAALVLVAVLLSEKPLSLSSFPTLLLMTTLSRLALNVSTTRLILGEATAGEVVAAFGRFVVQGDVVLGLVVFLALTIVQFVVIAKGAERVAEVGARFTLDAMPGKQMSIDASVRSGAIDEEEGEARRAELNRESQFYGAMDGAMKFVKGDAIAGLLMTGINLVVGMLLGSIRHDMTFSDAASVYAVLTIGDGLVSQIPSLLIAMAAGILTTRVASKTPKTGLGSTLKKELFGDVRVLVVGAVFAAGIGLVPGLPAAPFIMIGAGLALMGYAVRRGTLVREMSSDSSEVAAFRDTLTARVQAAKAQRAVADQLAPMVPMLGVDLDPLLSKELGFGAGRDEHTELMSVLIPQLRDALFAETGVRAPGVHVRSNTTNLPAHAVALRVKDVRVATESIRPDRAMAMETPDRIGRFGVSPEPAEHPISRQPVSLIPRERAKDVEEAGISVWSPSGVVALHLARVMREHLSSLVGLQETGEMVDRLGQVCPTLVKEVLPRVVTLPQLADVLKRLVEERVSIRDLRSILEALGEWGDRETDAVTLTEHVRAALSLQIAYDYAGESSRLGAVLLDDTAEEAIRTGIVHNINGSYLALDPEVRREILAAIARAFKPATDAGVRPILLTHADIRRYVRKLVEVELPEVVALSFEELPPALIIQPVGRVRVFDGISSAA